MKTGTLQELNVQPGDVVELEGCEGEKMTVLKCPPLDHYFHDHWEIKCEKSGTGLYSPNLTFAIISRDETPKKWRDMTAEEKGALLLAAHEGKVIESYDGHEGWGSIYPVWSPNWAYRVKPDDVRETVRVDIRHSYRGYILGTGTIDLINGEPDPASIRMDKL